MADDFLFARFLSVDVRVSVRGRCRSRIVSPVQHLCKEGVSLL